MRLPATIAQSANTPFQTDFRYSTVDQTTFSYFASTIKAQFGSCDTGAAQILTRQNEINTQGDCYHYRATSLSTTARIVPYSSRPAIPPALSRSPHPRDNRISVYHPANAPRFVLPACLPSATFVFAFNSSVFYMGQTFCRRSRCPGLVFVGCGVIMSSGHRTPLVSRHCCHRVDALNHVTGRR